MASTKTTEKATNPAPKQAPVTMKSLSVQLGQLVEIVGSVAQRVGDLESTKNPATTPAQTAPNPTQSQTAQSHPVSTPASPVPGTSLEWSKESGLGQGGQKMQPSFMPHREGRLVEVAVPEDFMEIKNQILGEEFGIKVESYTDRTAFRVTIVVPEQFSDMNAEQWQLHKADTRSLSIEASRGAEGVSGHCMLISNQLHLEQRRQPGYLRATN